jgi:hypothetical protein
MVISLVASQRLSYTLQNAQRNTAALSRNVLTSPAILTTLDYFTTRNGIYGNSLSLATINVLRSSFEVPEMLPCFNKSLGFPDKFV